ncbi:MAG: Rv3235 family protein [Arachnia sp.]
MNTEVFARPLTRTPTPPALPRVPSQRYSAPPQAVRLALATLEALLGRRGLHQLRPRLSRSAFLQLASHVDSGIFDRSLLGRLRTQMPTPLAVEATARISLDDRWLACTVRLDRAEQWQCSDLTVIGVGRPEAFASRRTVGAQVASEPP